MVQLMKSSKVSPPDSRAEPMQQQQRGKVVAVKREADDSVVGDDRGPLYKRSKSQQSEPKTGGFPVPPSEFNPLDEPSPLGLRLRKSPSLLDLIQMRLSQGSTSKSVTHTKKENKGGNTSVATDKLKASNFPASLLKIGTWEYKSRYEGDLVAKCYFAKHKLVWEVLDGGLKNKIEIQWSDIMALKANYPDDGPGTLDVVLSRQPLFFRETNPQPRKHTLWQATSDFTGGQASLQRRHFLQCPQGLLGKHFEKLVQCDPRLSYLSQQAEVVLESPYFEPRISVFDESNESKEYDLRGGSAPAFDLGGALSGSGSSKSELQETASRPLDFSRETLSPSSVIDTAVMEEMRVKTAEVSKVPGNWDQIKVPGLHSSMSMSDLVTHIENRISGNHALSSPERESLEMLEDIRRCLFADSQYAASASDEKSIMARVNSLCCLLQKDPCSTQEAASSAEANKRADELSCLPESGSEIRTETEADDGKKGTGMSRKDSVGELLLNLPRIASLPRFFFNVPDDFDSQAR